jgi:hypothetical protein
MNTRIGLALALALVTMLSTVAGCAESTPQPAATAGPVVAFKMPGERAPAERPSRDMTKFVILRTPVYGRR